MKVYVGATFSRYEEVRRVVDALVAAGHEVTHDWTRTDAFGPDGHPRPELGGGYSMPPAEARRHAQDDVRAVLAADCCVFLGQEASCGWPVELGIAIGADKPCAVVAPFKWTVFWELPMVVVFDTVEDALGGLGVSL